MAWPTTDEPRTNFVTVRFTDAEMADVLWLQGVVNAKDRSTAVRQCVDRVVAAERKRAAKQRRASTDSRTLAEAPEE